MRDDDWFEAAYQARSLQVCCPGQFKPSRRINSRVGRDREKNGLAVANCASLPSNLFLAVQSRTLMFCCGLVPFGRSGSRGSKRSALRGLVYVSRGRC
jgi:hypothetical protein